MRSRNMGHFISGAIEFKILANKFFFLKSVPKVNLK